jgi:hypothetical protein
LHFQNLNPVCLSFNAPRVGNEHFATDFNHHLAHQPFTYPEEGARVLCRSYRFDQMDDPVTWGQKYAFLYPLAPDSGMPEAGMKSKAIKSALRADDLLQAYFHVKHRKTVSILGEHKYTEMMDSVLGIKASSMVGLFDCRS